MGQIKMVKKSNFDVYISLSNTTILCTDLLFYHVKTKSRFFPDKTKGTPQSLIQPKATKHGLEATNNQR